MSTIFDNASHSGGGLSLGPNVDLVLGTASLWTRSTNILIFSFAGSNLFRNAGQVYADTAAVGATGNSVRVENLVSGIIAAGSGAAIALLSTNTVVNAGYISGATAIAFSGSGNDVVNTGTIVGETNTIEFGTGNFGDSVTNSGTIISTADDAIQFVGQGINHVVNTGLISAKESSGILALSTGATTIANSGTITAFTAIQLNSATDTVMNSGLIIGQVSLGGGDDLFDSSTGLIDGTVAAGSGDDTVIGGSSGDRFDGATGDDLLIGNDGNDVLTGGVGGDELDGGAGRDTADYLTSFAVTADLADASANTGDALGDLFIGIENLTGSIGGDRLFGDNVRNVLRGAEGDDVLDAREGGDRMVGGIGDDTYVVDDARDRTVELNSSGVDTVRATVSYASQESIETIVLLGNAAINATGNSQANAITGNGGANVLNGAFANDSLTGGGGADTFRFDSALDPDTNVDTVNDFLTGTDKVSLSRAIFTELNGGAALQAGRFVIGDAALDANDRVLYNATTGVLSYDADGNGNGAQIAFAQLGTGLALSATDFVLTG